MAVPLKLQIDVKPATVFLQKIADAVEGYYKPSQIRRVAEAEADAALTLAESQIKVTEIQKRAIVRFANEETKKQLNMEAITQNALPLLEDKSTPQNMADDWITNFFEKSRIISDKDMQQLWAKILAGEANKPGAFAKRTVNLLADFEKSDAELFTSLCGFCWMLLSQFQPLVFDTQDEQGKIYNDKGINLSTLSHLESLGLINLDITSYGYKLPKKIRVFYYDRPVDLTFPEEHNKLPVGKVILTRAGQQLAPVCGSVPVTGFFEHVYDIWAGQNLVPKRN